MFHKFVFKTKTERRLAVLAALISLPAIYGAYAFAADTVKMQVVAEKLNLMCWR